MWADSFIHVFVVQCIIVEEMWCILLNDIMRDGRKERSSDLLMNISLIL